MVSSAPEAEWDDQERAKRLAWDLYQSQICSCGLHESIADTDPDVGLKVRICPTCRGIAEANRKIAAEDDKAIKELGENPPPEAPRPGDGRHVGLRMKDQPQVSEMA